VKVGEELAVGAKGDGVGLCAATAPQNREVIVCEVEVIASPVDKWVDGGKPRFAKNEVVIGERVDKGVKGIRIIVAGDGEGTGKGG